MSSSCGLHITCLATGPFEAKIDQWNSTLQIVSDVIEEWLQLQHNWLYLQPIFDSPDLNKQLPLEGKRFATVDKYWRATMKSASKKAYAIKFCADQRILERFKEGNKLLELVQKGLSDYLETKRAGFSRFYFLSDDELLEILSETKDPLRVQPHLRKCFEGLFYVMMAIVILFLKIVICIVFIIIIIIIIIVIAIINIIILVILVNTDCGVFIIIVLLA